MRKTLLWLLLAGGALTGCSRPTAVATGGTMAWIDAPLDGSSLPLAPVAVVGHGADPSGVALVEFSVDSELALDPGPPENSGAALVTWQHTWDPGAPGTYTLRLRVQGSAGEWSPPAESRVTIIGGETPTPIASPTSTAVRRLVASPTPTCSLLAQFVADVSVPDGTMFPPGAAFTKTWRLRNAGDCVWGPGFSLVFVGGSQMGGPSPLPLPRAVEPGQTIDLSVGLIAPSGFGRYRGEWMLQDPQGRRFGLGAEGQVAFWVEIVVGATPTAAPDAQPPVVSASHNPPGASIPVGTQVTFTATASDNVGVARIEIWMSSAEMWPQAVQTCYNTTNCTYQGTFSAGTIYYSARAYDAAGNMASSSQASITFYYVVH